MESHFTITTESEDHSPHVFAFPGGERHVRIGCINVTTGSPVIIKANIYTAAGIMDLMLLTDALRRAYPSMGPLHLELPYVPYARQDRVAVRGEPLSIAVMAGIINSLKFASVTIADPHSDVTPALIDRVMVIPASGFVSDLQHGALATRGIKEFVIVAPDAGARKRAEEAGNVVRAPVVNATKKRDPATGQLSCASLEQELPNLPVLVVDDLCDAGGTFIQLAKALKEKTTQPLFLYVTHGLFTKGLDPLLEHYDGVFAAVCAQPLLAHKTSIHGF